MKSCLVYAVIASLLSVAPALAADPRPTEVHDVHNIPETPQQRAARRQCGLLEKAGLDAARAHDYADAATDLRRATQMDTFVAPWTWVELGLVLDYQGKQREAFATYQKAFGSPIGSTFGTNSPQLVEALTRYGAMCEDRGLHESAVQCFNKAREWGESGYIAPLNKTLNPQVASPSLVRTMLDIVRGVALEQQEIAYGQDRSDDAMAAFRAAVGRSPDDPRPYFFLAYGFRHAGRFVEAEAVLQKASRLDTSGSLKAATGKSLEYTHNHWR